MGVRGLWRDSPPFCIATDPLRSSTRVNVPRKPPLDEDPGPISVPFQTWKAFLLMSIGPSYSNAPPQIPISDFHRAVPHTGIPLVGQLSTAIWPLAMTSESRNPDGGTLGMFKSSITAEKRMCSSAHQTGSLLAFQIRVVVPSPWHCCL